jgi:hypothetical protein
MNVRMLMRFRLKITATHLRMGTVCMYVYILLPGGCYFEYISNIHFNLTHLVMAKEKCLPFQLPSKYTDPLPLAYYSRTFVSFLAFLPRSFGAEIKERNLVPSCQGIKRRHEFLRLTRRIYLHVELEFYLRECIECLR